MTETDQRIRSDGIRLSVPPGLAHVRLVRSCLRQVLEFVDDDQESRFLLAVTEVVVNAIEASLHCALDSDAPPPATTVEFGPPPVQHVDVIDRAGGFVPNADKTDHLGAGLAIASSLVDLEIADRLDGTRVRLILGRQIP